MFFRDSVRRSVLLILVAGGLIGATATTAQAQGGNPVSVYGAWHCGNDYCQWAVPRDLAEFESNNRWLVDRGDAYQSPSVNLVVLSFVNPAKLLDLATDATTFEGVPRGMTPQLIGYLKGKGIRVMLSIGGITYVKDWNAALKKDPERLGRNAAFTAHRLGVGIEIDYEENRNPDLDGLQKFIDAYRSYVHTDGTDTLYDWTGNNHAARLTIDLAAGDRWLIALTRKATTDWLNTTNPVLDYANAMVPSRQPRNAEDAQTNWQEHIEGKGQYSPPIPPLAPAKFTGGLYIVTGKKPAPECTSFLGSLEDTTGEYVQTVGPQIAGTTSGMLGYMFWAAECPSSRRACTTPPDGCRDGVGFGAGVYTIPIPMQPLRQF